MYLIGHEKNRKTCRMPSTDGATRENRSRTNTKRERTFQRVSESTYYYTSEKTILHTRFDNINCTPTTYYTHTHTRICIQLKSNPYRRRGEAIFSTGGRRTIRYERYSRVRPRVSLITVQVAGAGIIVVTSSSH